MKSTDSIRVPNTYVVVILATLLSGAIGFNAWAVNSVYVRPTKDEVTEMIVDKSPFARDRSLILQSLIEIKQAMLELKRSVDQNSKAVAELKAVLGNN